MGFEVTEPTAKQPLHPELAKLDMAKTVASQPDGAIYRCEDGARYRLVHPRPAKWVAVRTRKARKANGASATA